MTEVARLIDNMHLREKVYARLSEWTGATSSRSADELVMLLGYHGWLEMIEGFTDEDRRTCEMLLGPNGFTVYKVLLARQK